MASENIITVSDENFEQEVLQADRPVLVDFWADWCGPCRMVAPVLDEIAEQNTKVRIAKLNVDENQALAIRFGVQSIPTFILFKGGEVAERALGAMPKQAFEELIDRNV